MKYILLLLFIAFTFKMLTFKYKKKIEAKKREELFKDLKLIDLKNYSLCNIGIKQRDNLKIEIEKILQERIQRLTKLYGKETVNDIFNGDVRIGWNKEQCIESWGEPKIINNTPGVWITYEQWVYGDGKYLYFENGKLRSIQN